MSYRQFPNRYKFVQQKADFPVAIADIITLEDNTTYIIAGAVDLGTSKLVCGLNNSIMGTNIVSSSLTSSLGAGVALITSTKSLQIEDLTLSHTGLGKLFDCNAVSAPGSNMILSKVIMNGVRVGNIQNYSIFFANDCLAINLLDGFQFDGAFTSLLFDTISFSTSTGGISIITLPATVSIATRFRIVFSVFNIGVGANGINVSTSATIPADTYIQFLNQWAGSGTYLVGVQSTDNKAFFKDNRGISNSVALGQYNMSGNVTASDIITQNVFIKVAGTTTAGLVEKFTHSNNRLTYNGTLTKTFRVSIIGAFATTSGNEIAFRLAKNGTTDASSEFIATAAGAAVFVSLQNQGIVTLALNDFLELWVANTSATNDVTVDNMNVLLTELP